MFFNLKKKNKLKELEERIEKLERDAYVSVTFKGWLCSFGKRISVRNILEELLKNLGYELKGQGTTEHYLQKKRSRKK